MKGILDSLAQMLRAVGTVLGLLILVMLFPTLGGIIAFIVVLNCIGVVFNALAWIYTLAAKATGALLNLLLVKPFRFMTKRR